MLKIKLNKKLLIEKQYALNVLLNEFLGIEFQIEVSENNILNFYEICLPNGNKLKISDSFFSSIENEDYLNINNIPSNVSYLKCDFSEESLPVLFGDNQIDVSNTEITLNADIIASSFFMLTRWEEIVIEERDNHQRFSSKSSLAHKFNFLHRPIVNEYVEFLWNMLVYLGTDQKRKERKFEIIPTHDVDLPRLWWNVKGFIKYLAGDFLKRKDIKAVLWSFKNYFSKLKGGKDPYDTFDYLMSLSEKNGIKSHFFFMSGGVTNKDNYYKIDHPIVLELLQEIDERGHGIGFHPSYNAYNDNEQFKKELTLLKKYSPQPIETGREHFLRFENPKTWSIWEENNMKWDSTMSYADHEGFRCGVCYPFPVFDVFQRKQLNLIERPLIVMDGSLVTYQDLTFQEGYDKVNNLVQEVKKYEGEFVFLWHNSAFNTLNWKPFQLIYERILNENSNHHRG